MTDDNQSQAPGAGDQMPTRADYQRAAAVCLHHHHRDTLGWNTVVAEADEQGRLSALIITLTKLVFWPGSRFASPDGIAALERLAAGMALDELSAEINRSLTPEERSLLLQLAIEVVAQQTGADTLTATDTLYELAVQGKVAIRADAEDAYLEASGTVLVHAERAWLAHRAAHPGYDPMKDGRRIPREGDE